MLFDSACKRRSQSTLGAGGSIVSGVSHGSLDDRTTHCAAINHTARDVFSGREAEAFVLEGPVNLIDIDQVGATIGSSCPCLNKLQHLALDSIVWGNGRGRLQQRCQIVHELARGDLGDEVRAAVLDACVGELVSQLAVRQTPSSGGGDIHSERLAAHLGSCSLSVSSTRAWPPWVVLSWSE